ncbi:phosphoglucosamine mutase [Salinisphaera sp. PC39]|uniref:phosphoglucosamine mutase n=1 Tax=Salinisphaera sp. PC39 TaxID=1304156 RepID=UPI00334106A4
MTRRYFGTDGIRGTVGEPPMTPDFLLRLGWAAGRELTAETGGERPRVLIGKDTRLSGYMFESALEAGFAAAGVDVLLVGPMPTPAIAYLARTFRAAAGVVISASHNPFVDNGVKFFSGDGRKLPDAVESNIEARLEQPVTCVAPAELGRARRLESAPGRYIEFCKSSFRLDDASLKGLKLVVDCANGASYHVAPDVFRELGAEVTAIADEPDGLNINRDCGSTHVDTLCAVVRESGADVGIALDGDGDRCIMVDDAGAVVDGDQLLYVIARARQAEAALRGPVVGTLMSNLGLERALARAGIGFERAKVGDRYVFERLLAVEGNLGGESSGHILCLDRTSTGDGIVSALQVLAAMVARGEPLRGLVADVEKCPQVLINVPVANGLADGLLRDADVTAAVDSVESGFDGDGRVLLRPSGTEPLIRVMVEGVDESAVRAAAERVADTVREAAARRA